MGPLDASRPWETRDVVGMYRFLQRLWRNLVDEETGDVARRSTRRPTTTRSGCCTARSTACATDMDALRFNTAIAKLIELNNHLTKLGGCPREVAEPLVLMVAPLAPHVAEELWAQLGHDDIARLRAVPRRRPGAAGRRHRRVPGAGQRQGPRPHHGRRRRSTPARSRRPRWPTRRSSPRSTARRPKKVIVVPGRMVNIVV